MIDSVTTKIRDEQNFDQQQDLSDNEDMDDDDDDRTVQLERPELPEQPELPDQPELPEQLWKFDPNTSTLSNKKGPWRYETKAWNIFPAEGATGILRDTTSSLLLTISTDDLVVLDVPWDLGPADGPEEQIWV